MRTLSNLTNVKSISSLFFVVLVMSLSLSAQPMMNEEPYFEAELEVESWMTDLESFNSDEPTMEVEEWMTDLNNYYNEDNEQLALEDWMTDLESFNISEEESLTVELWMTSIVEFNNSFDTYLLAEADETTVEVEEWMTNIQDFSKVDASEIKGIKEIYIESACPVLIALQQ